MAAMAAPKIKLKLLVDIKAKKVLFAEAGKDFIDFLTYLLSLPLCTVVSLLKEENLMDSLGRLYRSIQNLPHAYLQPDRYISSLLYPRAPIDARGFPLKLPNTGYYPKSYFCSNNSHLYVADVPNLLCPSCKQKMTRELSYVTPSPTNNTGVPVDGGFVKGLIPYIVTDYLEIKSMSTNQFITLLNNLSVKEVAELEEVVVEVGVNEGLKLLKASMECKTVLTNVFFDNIGKQKTTQN